MAKRNEQREFAWVKAFFENYGLGKYMETCRHSIQAVLQRELDNWAIEVCGPKGKPKGTLRRNGRYSRGLLTMSGWVTLNVPRFRGGKSPPPVFEPYQRHSAEVMMLWVTLFSMNMSCRNVAKAIKNSLGTGVSFQTIYRWVKKTGKFMENAVTEDICEKYYGLIMDGVYGRLRDCETPGKGVLLATMGVSREGDVTLVGVTPARRESSKDWAGHIQSLVRRGLAPESVEIVTTDNHVAFPKTIPENFANAAHQSCIFHTTMDVASKVPVERRASVKKLLSQLWSAKTPWSYFMALAKINKSLLLNDRALRCLHRHVDKTMAYYKVPEHLVKKVRTTNRIETLFRSLRARTRRLRGWQTTETLTGMLILTADSRGLLNEYT